MSTTAAAPAVTTSVHLGGATFQALQPTGGGVAFVQVQGDYEMTVATLIGRDAATWRRLAATAIAAAELLEAERA